MAAKSKRPRFRDMCQRQVARHPPLCYLSKRTKQLHFKMHAYEYQPNTIAPIASPHLNAQISSVQQNITAKLDKIGKRQRDPIVTSS